MKYIEVKKCVESDNHKSYIESKNYVEPAMHRESKQNLKKKMNNQGMMTVEAALIVPIILIIVTIQMFFCLFLIDMSVAKSETLRLADETAAVWKTDGKLADGTYKSRQLLDRNKRFLCQNTRSQLTGRARTRLTTRISSRLNRASLSEKKVSISGDKVSVNVSLRLEIPLWGSRKYTGMSGWTFQCKGSATLSNEEELLRKEMAKKSEER